MATRQHPNQGIVRKEAEAVDKQIGVLFQIYERFGHDMSDVERKNVRQALYDLSHVTVGAEIKPGEWAQ